MKIRLLNAGLCACALLMTLSGCSSDETLTGDNSTATQSMKINVSDGMFTSGENNGAKTRAKDSGTETTFTSGDAIGIFAVKSDGTLALTNAKYTYDGTSKWLNSNPTEYLTYYEGAKYFAYYPYQESLTSDKYDATTAETFFASLISSWAPAADQSTQANYTAQDLMVSMARVDATTHAASFAMAHQMSMIEFDFPQVHYTYNGADVYRFTFDAPNKPYNIADGKYRLLVNPNTSLSITGNNKYNGTDGKLTTKRWRINGTTPATAKYKIYKYNGAPASLTQNTDLNVCVGDATIGNYLYADGTTGTTTAGKTIVGIVFSNRLSSAEYNAGYTHGYALALTDASTGTSWGPYPGDAGLTKVTTFSAYYNDINAGYYGTFIKGYNKSNGSYPAWQAANNYNVNVSGFKNSGWYLPSMGQWWDVCANLGKVDLTSMQTSSSSYGNIYSGSTATTNVNAAINAAVGGQALTSRNYYWSASECSRYVAAVVNFDTSSVDLRSGRKYLTFCYVRAVLAF